MPLHMKIKSLTKKTSMPKEYDAFLKQNLSVEKTKCFKAIKTKRNILVMGKGFLPLLHSFR